MSAPAPDDREPLDPLDARIARLVGPDAPPEGIEDRVLAALRGPDTRRRLYWARADAFARRLVPAAALALLVAAAILAALAHASRPGPAGAPAPAPLAPPDEAIERNLRDGTWLVSLRRTR